MAKIAYPNKQTAVNPASPASNEVFTATNANEIKDSVNYLYDSGFNSAIEFTSNGSGTFYFGSTIPALPALKTLYYGTLASPIESAPMGIFNPTTRIMKFLDPSTNYVLIY